MRNKFLALFLVPLILFGCSSGKKALQKGNYYAALTKAVERLKSNPSHKNATKVIENGYPMALQWWQEEIDQTLSSNQEFKWEYTVVIMLQVNSLDKLIRSTPAARQIIPTTKSYGNELNMAMERAAINRYDAGILLLNENSNQAARQAYEHFHKANQYFPGYKDVHQKMQVAKQMATIKVVVEAITVRTRNYQLSSEFFYDQVFEYLYQNFSPESFVAFYSPAEAENLQIERPDFIVNMEFYDFSVGNLVRNEKEENLVKRVKVPVNDTTEVSKTYRAKLKTFTDEVISGGRLEYRVTDFNTNQLIRNELIPGSFTWINRYAIFAGDAEALTDEQFALTQNRALPLPPNQELFIEFTRPIYDRLTADLYSFFRKYR
jgi:hypothetical protein